MNEPTSVVKKKKKKKKKRDIWNYRKKFGTEMLRTLRTLSAVSRKGATSYTPRLLLPSSAQSLSLSLSPLSPSTLFSRGSTARGIQTKSETDEDDKGSKATTESSKVQSGGGRAKQLLSSILQGIPNEEFEEFDQVLFSNTTHSKLAARGKYVHEIQRNFYSISLSYSISALSVLSLSLFSLSPLSLFSTLSLSLSLLSLSFLFLPSLYLA
jgi:hypothetical protein